LVDVERIGWLRESNRVQGRNVLGEAGVTKEEAWKLANEWIAAWNAHDLDAILTHYDEAVELTSPVAAQLLGIPGGKVSGKANVSAYFQ